MTIATALFVENMRRPRLSIQIEDPPPEAAYQNRPAQNTRWVRVLVSNEPLPSWAAWLMREVATRCRAEITFHDCDSGRRIFSRPMEGRWAGTVQPLPIEGRVGDQQILIFDPARWASRGIDISPGERPEPLDIAAKFDSDEACYGWNNEAYFSNPPWRNPERRLGRGQFLVRVSVHAVGQRIEGTFSLNNMGTRGDFRLERASPEEAGRVHAAEGLGGLPTKST